MYPQLIVFTLLLLQTTRGQNPKNAQNLKPVDSPNCPKELLFADTKVCLSAGGVSSSAGCNGGAVLCNSGKSCCCPVGQELCGGKCQSKSTNQICVNSKFECPAGQEVCGDKCANLLEGASCNEESANFECGIYQNSCGGVCQTKLILAQCVMDVLGCSDDKGACGGVCSEKYDDSICNEKTGAFECVGDGCKKKPVPKPCPSNRVRCGRSCELIIEGAICKNGDLKCENTYSVCNRKCQYAPAGSTCIDGKFKCKPGFTDCDGTCQLNTENAECDSGRFICKPGYKFCGNKCAEYYADSYCEEKEKQWKCPPDKPLCNKTCKTKTADMICTPQGWDCPEGMALCNKKCQKKFTGSFCNSTTFTCPDGMDVCGGNCATKRRDSTCNKATGLWECPKGTYPCGPNCMAMTDYDECEFPTIVCPKDKAICIGSCMEKPLGSFCSSNNKNFTCPEGTQNCNKACKKYIKGAKCQEEGWICPEPLKVCGDNCVEGPFGGVCINEKIECLKNFINCNGACLRFSKENCGECGKVCATEMAETCDLSSGKCICQANHDRCNGSTRPCVDLTTSLYHCGKCGNPCINGKKCVAGSCV